MIVNLDWLYFIVDFYLILRGVYVIVHVNGMKLSQDLLETKEHQLDCYDKENRLQR